MLNRFVYATEWQCIYLMINAHFKAFYNPSCF